MGEARRRQQAENDQKNSLEVRQAPTWPLANFQVQKQLEREFTRLGIDYSQPGFHDSFSFLAAEAKDPTFIDRYAQYVEARYYTDSELTEAKRKIEIASDVVSKAVQSDGRHGLCVVASGVLSRILDELGVWNFCAKSTLTITFPTNVSSNPQYFYALDQGNFTAPHAVVVAPPFLLVDTTVSAQAYANSTMSQALPSLIMQQQFTSFEWNEEDIAAPHVRIALKAKGKTVHSHLQSDNPHMLKMMNAFPARLAEYAGGSLGYVITGVGGYSEKINELTHHTNINGKSASNLLKEQVQPRLSTGRSLPA